MPEFTVTRAAQKKEIPDGKFGPMQVISLDLTGADGKEFKPCEWYTKATTPVPAVGSRMAFEPPEWNEQFKVWKVKRQQQGGHQQRFGRSPADQRSIVRQHSQEMAIRWLTFLSTAPDFDWSFMSDATLRREIDWFEKDASSSAAPLDVGGRGETAGGGDVTERKETAGSSVGAVHQTSPPAYLDRVSDRQVEILTGKLRKRNLTKAQARAFLVRFYGVDELVLLHKRVDFAEFDANLNGFDPDYTTDVPADTDGLAAA